MSKVRRKIRKLNRESTRSGKRTEIRRRNFAILLFILVLAFCAGEMIAVFTAKNHHDYLQAQKSSEELSVELSLISSALKSGNKTLYDNSISRFQTTLQSFTDNDYVRAHKVELSSKLRDYNKTLSDNSENINELLELDAALDSLSLELDEIETDKLNAVAFYQVQQSLQRLSDTLGNLKTEEYKELRDRIGSFANKIAELAKNSAVCVSVCPRESFVDKQNQLENYRKEYAEDFKTLGSTVSEKYNPSALILELGQI